MRRLESLLTRSLVASFEVIGLARVGMGVFLAVYAATYRATPTHPRPGWVTPTVIALGLAGIPAGLAQWSKRLRGSVTLANFALGADVLVVCGVLAAYAFDPRRFVFALVFPTVIEGAVVSGLVGSIATGVGLSLAYAVIEATLAHETGGPPAVILRIAAALAVATMAGAMTEVVRRERASLRRSEARFRAATDHATDAVLLLTPEGKITFLSAGGPALLGREANEALGERAMDYVHPDDLEAVAKAFSDVLESSGATASIELRALHADGSWHWMENRARNLVDDPDIGAIVVHTRDITQRKELEAELAQRLEDIRQAGEERRRLLGRIVTAQEEERAWVADALHDDPIQKLTAALMRVELVRDAGTSEKDRAALDSVASTIGEAIETLRRLMVELRSVPLERLGLAPALREHFERLSVGDAHLKIVDEVHREPDQPTRLVAYRIAQEAIANAVKHSNACEVTVTLASRDGGLAVDVNDDGVGFDVEAPAAAGHVGLTSMRERAELAGGRCRVESSMGEGTTVSFWIPGGPERDE